jgi:hypothetical protein
MGVRNCSTEYFRTIHVWFPILSQTRYFERLPELWHEPKAAHSLLAMCMLLLVTCPTEFEMPSDMLSLYALIKGSISLLDAVGETSLEVLQCQLLVNLFEIGHGMYPAAYISNSTNTMTGTVLGIYDRSKTWVSNNNYAWATKEEATRVWQGIAIIDRLVEISLATVFICYHGE